MSLKFLLSLNGLPLSQISDTKSSELNGDCASADTFLLIFRQLMIRRAPTKHVSPAPRRAAGQVYPFTAIVGQEEMKLALLLNVIDPLIGGVLIMGHRGTGKSTAVRAIADLLPQIWKVSDCPYGCDPAEAEDLCAVCYERLSVQGKLSRTRADVPVVDLPLGATEDRVCGTINIERALKEGVKAFEPGLLARANRGFLYVDEVNLLEDHLVDLLLDVTVTGRNTVEREGISLAHPARFVLVGSGNPEEGELRPQLLDRFGLYAEVRTVIDLDQRVLIVNLREAFERDATQFRASVEAEQGSLRRKLSRARKLAGEVSISQELLRGIASLCLELNIDGHRGELTIARAARSLAAFEGRREVSEADVRRVAALSLRHRLRRDPLEPTGGGTRIEQALEKNFPPTEPNTAHARSRASSNEPIDADGSLKAEDEKPAGAHHKDDWIDTDGGDDKDKGHDTQRRQAGRLAPAPLDTQVPEESLEPDSRTSFKPHSQKTSSRHQRGSSRITHHAPRGRYTRAVVNRPPESKIALDATLRATAINSTRNRSHENKNTAHSPAPYTPHPAHRLEDLRFKKFKRKQGTLFILAIDTSGSMALNRIEQAKGALVRLLEKSYIRRDHVALVSFRGAEAEELLSPSQSMSRARRLLDELLMGGATPLASALACALGIAGRAARQGTERISLLLFTDGRANVALREHELTNPVLKQAAIMSELERLSAALRKASVGVAVFDTQNRFTSGGECRALAERLGARYVYLASTDAVNEQLSARSFLEI
jgi:magnesium chelatase ATPase subunit I